MTAPMTGEREATWRPVIGFEGLYEVSDTGQVRTVERMLRKCCDGRRAYFHLLKGSIRKTYVNADGYESVTLCVNGVKRVHHMHRLMMDAFKGPSPNGMIVRHLNGDPSDNRLCNLAWGTHADNARDRMMHGRQLRGEKNYNAKLTDVAVRDIRSSSLPVSVLAQKYGVTQTHIGAVKSGRSWRHVDAA